MCIFNLQRNGALPARSSPTEINWDKKFPLDPLELLFGIKELLNQKRRQR